MVMSKSNLDPNLLLQEKSRHLLSILLQIGHPVDADYLSSRGRFFNASSDFVLTLHLSLIHLSPLTATVSLLHPSKLFSPSLGFSRFKSLFQLCLTRENVNRFYHSPKMEEIRSDLQLATKFRKYSSRVLLILLQRL